MHETKTIVTNFTNHFVTELMSNDFADFLNLLTIKTVVLLLYMCYIAGAIYGCWLAKLGLDMRDLVPYDSHVRDELEARDRFFSAYGGYAYFVIEGKVPYHLTNAQGRIMKFYEIISNTPYTSSAPFWLDEFLADYGFPQSQDESIFSARIHEFLSNRKHQKFKNDVSFYENQIVATKIRVRLRNCGSANWSEIANGLRTMFEESQLPGFAFEPHFFLEDQQQQTIAILLQDIGIAISLMIFITAVFIPRLGCIFGIGVAILSINLGVVGYLRWRFGEQLGIYF